MAARFLRRMCAVGAALTAVCASVLAVPQPAFADSVRAKQWYLDAWKIDEVWKISRGDGITVAVVDTGVDATHPDLVGQIAGAPLGDGDDNGHGTGITSMIVGSGVNGGGQGVWGVAPEAKVLAFRVPDTPKSGIFDPDKLADTIRAAADSQARIINISSGGAVNEPEKAEAVQYALSRGKLVVASAGNGTDNGRAPIYPAGDPGVLGVGAVDQNGGTWSNSNQGFWVSIAAPGTQIPAACTGPTRYCMTDGTSGSAALTSGVAALVWSAHPDWTANQVINRLITSAHKGKGEVVPNDEIGFGIVNPRNALQSTDPPGPADVNPLINVRGLKPTPPPPSTPPPSTQPAPAAGDSASTPPLSPAPAVDSAGDKGGSDSNLLPLAAIGGGVVVLIAVAALYFRSRRGRGAPPPPPMPPAPPQASW
ncbi:type VII secretion-associated serine protease mycosin [Yinghuangia aomiensis]|uniref:Type VII secretion-associated serine protease mycosin n=1 Tax=Yinghuangia aomiensis TaxID=676205 RepID=A0ABP9GMQ5_9ACTN